MIRAATFWPARRGQRWVFQAKWKANAAVPSTAIDEVTEAKSYYHADRSVVVTNSRFGPSVIQRRDELRRVGQRVELWSGKELVELYGDERAMTPRLPERPLRPYQSEAFQCLVEDLEDRGKALLILATGLGKTVVGGEVIARHLRHGSGNRVLVVAHTKDLAEQLERALWYHIPKETRTQLLTGDFKPDDLRGITCATVASALSYVRGGYRPSLLMVDEAHHVGENGQFAELLDLLADVAAVRGHGDAMARGSVRHPSAVRRAELHTWHRRRHAPRGISLRFATGSSPTTSTGTSSGRQATTSTPSGT